MAEPAAKRQKTEEEEGVPATPVTVGFASYRASGPKVVKAGDKVPSIAIDHGFNPIEAVNLADRVKGKKVVIMGLPGAFTPC
jgi:2-Cys peroxiredoxin 5